MRNRRAILEGLLARERGAVLLSEEFNVSDEAAFKVTCEHGLEGIVSKRSDQPYAFGKGGDWVKTKCVTTDTFFIIGYQPGAHGGLGALHVATELVATGCIMSEPSARDFQSEWRVS